MAGQKGGGLSGLPSGLNITVTVQVQIPASPKAPDNSKPEANNPASRECAALQNKKPK